MFTSNLRHIFILFIMTCLPIQVFAWADWHEASFQYTFGTDYNQFGNQASDLDGTPVTGSAGETELSTFTVLYSNGWKYGDNFWYVDMFFEHDSTADNEIAFFTQGWSNFNLNKIFKTKAFEFGEKGKYIKYIGPSFGWQFFNLDDFKSGSAGCGEFFGKCVFEAHDTIDIFTGVKIELGNFGFDALQFAGIIMGAYHDLNDETDFDAQFYFDLYWRFNWYMGPTRWQYDGYFDIYDSRGSSKGVPYVANIYSQHQIKMDVGLFLAGRPNAFFIGTEIQWTQNGFGVEDVPFVSTSTDEFFPALLIEWVF